MEAPEGGVFAQGHFNMQLEDPGTEPQTLWLVDRLQWEQKLQKWEEVQTLW